MLPLYALTPDRLFSDPPGIQSGCVLHTFCVQADGDKIQAALDQRFTTPSAAAVKYEAIGSKMFVTVAEMARTQSADPPDINRGWLPETDVAIWALTRRAGTLDLRWIPLWLFVDTAPAMVTGREIYGFPKQIGRFDFSPQSQEPRQFLVSAYAMATFSKESKMQWGPLMALRPQAPAATTSDPGVLGGLEGLAEHVTQRLAGVLVSADLTLLASVTAAVGIGQSTLAFLKQFPDAVDPTRACYQGIIEADAKVLTVRSVALTSTPYTLELQSYASIPLHDQFGIQEGVQEVGHGIVVDFDFSISLGREVWRAI